jgi:hypothetical protein
MLYTVGHMPMQKSQTAGLIIALIVLNVVGFFVIYFKFVLDASLTAGDHAAISNELAQIKAQLNK